MRSTTLALQLLLGLSGGGGIVLAGSGPGNTSEYCLTRDETASIVDRYTLYLTTYPGNATVLEELHDENVVTASDSLSYVLQKPMNISLAHSIQDIIEQESTVRAVPAMYTIFMLHTCDTITWYWEFLTKPWPTRGIVALFVNLDSRKIYRTYREANVGALLLN